MKRIQYESLNPIELELFSNGRTYEETLTNETNHGRTTGETYERRKKKLPTNRYGDTFEVICNSVGG